MTPARGALMWTGFISCVLGLSFAAYNLYPDRPSAPKEYLDGLEAELGGPGALRVRIANNTKTKVLTLSRHVKLGTKLSELYGTAIVHRYDQGVRDNNTDSEHIIAMQQKCARFTFQRST
jgi:hypothetical protein